MACASPYVHPQGIRDMTPAEYNEVLAFLDVCPNLQVSVQSS